MLLKFACFCSVFLITSTTSSSTPVVGYENYLGTRTPYRVVANLNDSKLQYDNCTPTKIWMLVRHGTRNPSAKLITKMRERLPQIRDLIVDTNVADLLNKWRIYISENDQKLLTHEGEEEMLFLAKRMQQRFPDLLPAKYSNSSFKFKYTATQRTQESAKYFAAGLFGVENVDKVWFPEPSTKDPILRFYKLCTKWIKDVKKDPRTKAEQQKFQNTTLVNKTIEEINARLGLNKQLNFDDLHLMYQMCAFETAWNENTKSPWCFPFSIEAIKIMEYHEDLKYYWIDGYGHEITYKQACPAFNDMLNLMKSENSEPKAVLYFTHSGSILKMLAHLNLYKELQHLVHMEQKVREDRKWKVSKIDAFGTNLAFVLHKCDGSDKILLLHQEHVVRFPSCADSDLCDLDVLERDFSDSINSCSFNQICDNKTAEDD